MISKAIDENAGGYLYFGIPRRLLGVFPFFAAHDYAAGGVGCNVDDQEDAQVLVGQKEAWAQVSAKWDSER
jgi:hypothetical protein